MSSSEWLREAIVAGHILEIAYNEFSDQKVIARGAFGEVTLAHWSKADKKVALKSLFKNPSGNDKSFFEEFTNEVSLIHKMGVLNYCSYFY